MRHTALRRNRVSGEGLGKGKNLYHIAQRRPLKHCQPTWHWKWEALLHAKENWRQLLRMDKNEEQTKPEANSCSIRDLGQVLWSNRSDFMSILLRALKALLLERPNLGYVFEVKTSSTCPGVKFSWGVMVSKILERFPSNPQFRSIGSHHIFEFCCHRLSNKQMRVESFRLWP